MVDADVRYYRLTYSKAVQYATQNKNLETCYRISIAIRCAGHIKQLDTSNVKANTFLFRAVATV